jgi:5'-nucleotidase
MLLMSTPQILLTNDDGIASPGLWAAAQALSELGYVHVVAPRDQFSAAGRSLPSHTDGIIRQQEMRVNGQNWKVYSVGGTPAQTVLHAVLEILPHPPDLLVAGINYGENVGSGVTISGTVGAALEGASMSIPSMAISLETEPQHHYSHSDEVDFSAAATFAKFFGGMILKKCLPQDVDVLKIDIPCDAQADTPWMVTRLSRRRYFEPTTPERSSWETPGRVGYQQAQGLEQDIPDGDVYALCVRRVVSVTPLSLDLTSRIDLQEFEKTLRGN